MVQIQVLLFLTVSFWSHVASSCNGWNRLSVSCQRLRPMAVTVLNPSHQATRDKWVASDKAMAHQLCRNEFPHRDEKLWNKVFIRKEKHMGGVRESYPFSSLNHFTWGMSFRFPSCFAWFWVYIWFMSGSSLVCTCISQLRQILSKMSMARLTLPTTELFPSPFLTWKEIFCLCVVRKVSLTSRMRNMWSFISYHSRTHLLISSAILRVCP